MEPTDGGSGLMRRVVVSAAGIDVVSAGVPTPGPREVLVRSVVAGVCGSDTHAADGRHPFITLPYSPGHEVVGVVAGTGSEVTSVQPGQRVTVEPFLPCWHCKQCAAGQENLCENLEFFGCGYHQGGMADYFTIDARRLHVVPDEFDYPTAALIEPLATPVHAVRLAAPVTGRAVAILGAGTIGLLLLRTLLAERPKRVVVSDPLPGKRRRARDLGADGVIDPTAGDPIAQVRSELGESADIVFDCVSTASTLGQAIGMAAKGGTVVVVGVPAGEVPIPLHLVQDHQIRIQGSATYLPRDYAASIDLLRRGQIRAGDIVTSLVALDSVADAFQQSAGGQHVKVLLAIDDAALDRHRPVP